MQKTNVWGNVLVLVITILIFIIALEVTLRLTSSDVSENLEKYIETKDARNYENRPDFSYEINGISYNINSDGLRDIAHSKIKQSKTRVALLGDSVAFGTNVDVKNSFASLLENNDREIINFAVSGYDLSSEVEALKIKVVEYNPDIVLLAFVMNDIEPSDIFFKTEEEKTCILPVLKINVDCKTKDAIRSIKTIQFFYNGFQNLFYSGVQDYYTLSWGNEELYQNNIINPLNDFKEICDSSDFECGVIIFPLLRYDEEYPWINQHGKLINDLESLNLKYLSLLEPFQVFSAEELGGTSADILHPNELGHLVASEEIATFLNDFSN